MHYLYAYIIDVIYIISSYIYTEKIYTSICLLGKRARVARSTRVLVMELYVQMPNASKLLHYWWAAGRRVPSILARSSARGNFSTRRKSASTNKHQHLHATSVTIKTSRHTWQLAGCIPRDDDAYSICYGSLCIEKTGRTCIYICLS